MMTYTKVLYISGINFSLDQTKKINKLCIFSAYLRISLNRNDRTAELFMKRSKVTQAV